MTLATYEEVVDAEIVPDEITRQEARELTDRIRIGLDNIWADVTEAYVRGAHLALKYKSWDGYCEKEFGSSHLRLPKENRAAELSSMHARGMSQVAISVATGLDRKTIRNDLRKSQGGEIPHPVIGQDGKTYTRPEPAVSERGWPEVPEPEPATENYATDMANGLRNDSRRIANGYMDYLIAVAKNLPKENLPTAANEHVIKALRDNLAEITEVTNRAIAQIEGEGK